jgi:hypothetical protein
MGSNYTPPYYDNVTLTSNAEITMTLFRWGEDPQTFNDWYYSSFAVYVTSASNPVITELKIWEQGTNTVYFLSTQTQTISGGWTTFEIYGGTSPNNNLINTDQPLVPINSGKTTFEITIKVTSGSMTLLRYPSYNNTDVMPTQLFGYRKVKSSSPNTMRLTSSYNASTNFAINSGPNVNSKIARFNTSDLGYRIPSGNNIITCSYVPLNMPKDAQLYFNYIPQPESGAYPYVAPWYSPRNNTAVLQFTVSSFSVNDVTDTIDNSCFFRASTPSSLVQIPTLANFLPKKTNFNLYGIDPYNIFINSMAYNLKSINFGLGFFSGQIQYNLNNYTIIATSTIPTAGQISYNNATQHLSTLIRLNCLDDEGIDNNSLIAKLKQNDVININGRVSPSTSHFFLITSTPQYSNSVWSIPVSALGTLNNTNNSTRVNIDIYIFDTNKSCFILQDDIGMNLINIGNRSTVIIPENSSTVNTKTITELYLSSSQPTGKTWKYVIDSANSSINKLLFSTPVNLPQPPFNRTSKLTANVCLFNTNHSSITLKRSTQTPGEWVLVSSTGNNGFNSI